MSCVYAQKQQYDQAIAEGERAIALDPNNADSYAWQAEALTIAGRPEEALRAVEQAMRLNPRYPSWYLFELGWAYRLTGRYAEAIATLKEAISRSPNFLPAHIILAVSYLWQWVSQQSPAAQTLEPAVAAVQRALALNDSFHWNHIVLGYIYLYQQQYDAGPGGDGAGRGPRSYRGVELCGAGCGAELYGQDGGGPGGRRPGATPEAHYCGRSLSSVGVAYAVAGTTRRRVAPLQRFLSHYPNILLTHLMLAAVYSELGQAAEARAEAAEVLRLNPNFSLEVHKQRMPIKDPAVLERHIAALRKAGLK